ncbi:hypothetical protein ACCD08_21175 [Telluria sp. Tellsp104]
MTGAPRIDFVALKKYRVDAVDWSADHLPARDARFKEIHCLPLVEKLPRKHAREGDDLEGLDRPAQAGAMLDPAATSSGARWQRDSMHAA